MSQSITYGLHNNGRLSDSIGYLRKMCLINNSYLAPPYSYFNYAVLVNYKINYCLLNKIRYRRKYNINFYLHLFMESVALQQAIIKLRNILFSEPYYKSL